MSAPRWACALLRRLAPPDRAETVLGDLEEGHRERVRRRGRMVASLLTALEALDMSIALVRERRRGRGGRSAGQTRQQDIRRTSASNVDLGGGRRKGPGISWLDFKLGFRMLVRYPGLTLVGGMAMAFGICVGSAGFEVLTRLAYPSLPLEDGDRIVGITVRNTATAGVEPRVLHDFVTWREELESVEGLGTFRILARNLTVEQELGEPVAVTEITAAGLRVARVPPLMGRSLSEADEPVNAPSVVLIGYDVWQTRFKGDPNVIGRSIGLGGTPTTVVGVMPESFAFPLVSDFWAPLRLNVVDYDRGEGPAIVILGRLASGATLERAQTELTTLGQRAATEFPATHGQLRPQIMPFVKMFGTFPGLFSPEIILSNLFIVALIALLCANVGLLMFARAATRESELAVRNALGASRSRIIGQLFAEALVLGAVAAVIGLVAGRFMLQWGLSVYVASEGPLPWWASGGMSSTTVLYAGALTVLGAVFAGVVPGLKVTRRLGGRLKEGTAGGGLQFGGIWTAVIVTQVAVTVTFPAFTLFLQQEGAENEAMGVEVPLEEYLTVRLDMDREAIPADPGDDSQAGFLARYGFALQELERRLVTHAMVTDVTFADRLPRTYHEWNQIEIEGVIEPSGDRGHRVSRADIDPNYFDVLGAPVLSGRGFDTGDVVSGAQVVIVDEPFVDRVLGGRAPIGRLIRYIATESSREPTTEGPWYEIVGVVGDLGMESGYGRGGIYHPAARDDAYPVHVVAHVRGDPDSFGPQLRAIAASVDPTLQLQRLMTLDGVIDANRGVYAYWVRLTVLLSAVALMLSLVGIYSVMSYTVSRRTREIGVRVALGARPGRILTSIFRRPLLQVGVGIVAGAYLVGLMIHSGISPANTLSLREYTLLAAYAALMMCVCMLACVVPTRRALRIEPTEALRANG